MTNQSRTLYAGVTNDLRRRVYQHKTGEVAGFTARYNLKMLAYYEETNDIGAAIDRERQIKGWTRAKKIVLIEEMNPRWEDLANDWYSEEELSG
jgi:putative endonuclease